MGGAVVPPEPDFTDEDDPGRVEFFRPPDVPGVEVLVSERSSRRWVVLHHTYTVCTMRSLDVLAPWKYRRSTYDLAADSQMLMEPGEVHANVDVTAPATFRVLLMDPTLVERAATELGMRGTVHLRFAQTDAGSHPQLRRAFLSLHDSLEQPATTLERESLLAHCMRLLLEQCAEAPARDRRTGTDRASVRKAVDFIEANLTQPIGLHEVVEAAGAASRFQFVHSFTRIVGLPPHAYQIQRRIIRGRERLVQGINPAQVAAEMGFADQSHFGRHFRRVVGVPPATYARDVGVARSGRGLEDPQYVPDLDVPTAHPLDGRHEAGAHGVAAPVSRRGPPRAR